MDQVLQGIPYVQCYMDDMVIRCTAEEHLANVKVLDRLKEQGMKVNQLKCDFFKERIKYYGHMIAKSCQPSNVSRK